MAEVIFNQVTKRFETDKAVLQQFTLAVNDGEFIVLVGPSGCGKSTVLRLLAGLENVTEGEILIDQQNVNRMTPQQRNIALVFQNYALYPHMNVRTNLTFPLKMRGVPTPVIEKKVNEIAELLDLSQVMERKPKHLSGGQRQRVAMGRALVRDPNVFLLDEPLSNLDAQLRSKIRTEIAHLQKKLNKTTLYVTHDQVEAMTLGEKVAVMNNGWLQQVDTPEILYRSPQNTFVAQFIGNPGMNIIPTTIIQDSKGNFIVEIAHQKIALPTGKINKQSDFMKQSGDIVQVGIRPEAFKAVHTEKHIAIKLKIQSIEFLGHETLVYFQLPNCNKTRSGSLAARFTGTYHANPNTCNTIFFDSKSIYLFDENGQAI